MSRENTDPPDPADNEGRALYRALANRLADAQIAVASRRVTLTPQTFADQPEEKIMARGTFYLVTSYGAVHRISKAELAQTLFDLANGNGYNLSKSRYMGEIYLNLTDLSPEEASEEYKKLVQPIRTKHENQQEETKE